MVKMEHAKCVTKRLCLYVMNALCMVKAYHFVMTQLLLDLFERFCKTVALKLKKFGFGYAVLTFFRGGIMGGNLVPKGLTSKQHLQQ